jgi:Zn-dependent M16 (insulinase) family peptidase
MSHAPVLPAPTGFEPDQAPRLEGLAAPLQIAHCAMLLPAPHRSSPDEPLLAVGAHLVAHDYLLPEIRFKGNAYGASFSHQALSGVFALTSFRDPRIAGTLDVFRRVVDYVRQADWSAVDIERGIIGVAKRDERPLRPGEATAVALGRHVTGDTHARRTARRRRLLRATPDSVRQAMLTALEAGLPRASVCVMSGRAQIEQANAALGGRALSIEDVLKD